MKTYLAMCFLATVLATGCANSRTYVVVNGHIQPKDQVHFVDLSGSFHTYFSVSETYDDGPDSVGIDSLPINECIRIENFKSIGIFFNISIVNTKGWKFRVVKVVEADGKTPQQTELYSGNTGHKRFQLQAAPTPGKTRISAEIYLGESDKPIILGDACYILPGKEAIQNQMSERRGT